MRPTAIHWLELGGKRLAGFHVDLHSTDRWLVFEHAKQRTASAAGTFAPDTGACIVEHGFVALEELERIADARRQARRDTTREQRAELLEGLAELVRQCDAMRAGIASGDPIAMLEAADFVRATRPFDAASRAAIAEQNARELNTCIDAVFTERGFEPK